MISRYEFAQRIATVFRLNSSLIRPIPFSTDNRAERPLHSSFITLKAQTELGIRSTGIDEGLQVMLRGLGDLEDVRQIVYQ